MTKTVKKFDSLDLRYQSIFDDLSGIVTVARRHAFQSVNSIMTASYWLIGQYIVEFEQKGKERADYGRSIIKRLSVDLSARFGRGFSVRNLQQMRTFFLYWQKRPTASAEFKEQLRIQALSRVSGGSQKMSTASAESESGQKVQTVSAESSLTRL